MHKFKLTIEYEGTNYAGWQKQKDAMGVQQAIEEAIFAMSGERAETIVAGRTDSGVHAHGQVAHFETNKKFDGFRWKQGLNQHLVNHAISIVHAEEVDADFSARFSAKKRYYRYYILNRHAPSPLNKMRAWHVFQALDIEKIKIAAKHLEGEHDFSSFRASECQARNPIRTIDYIKVSTEKVNAQNNDAGEFIIFDVCGQSFLHNMVRNIVGTLKQVGAGNIPPEKIPEILAAKDRSKAGMCAPAHGLFFEKVDY